MSKLNAKYVPKNTRADISIVSKFVIASLLICSAMIEPTIVTSNGLTKFFTRIGSFNISLAAITCTSVTTSSAMVVPMAAHAAPYLGIRARLMIKSVTAPAISDIRTYFSLPSGTSI